MSSDSISKGSQGGKSRVCKFGLPNLLASYVPEGQLYLWWSYLVTRRLYSKFVDTRGLGDGYRIVVGALVGVLYQSWLEWERLQSKSMFRLYFSIGCRSCYGRSHPLSFRSRFVSCRISPLLGFCPPVLSCDLRHFWIVIERLLFDVLQPRGVRHQSRILPDRAASGPAYQ